MRVVVGITGASGVVLAKRLLLALKERGIETHLVVSENAKTTISYELGGEDLSKLATKSYDPADIAADISSSSFNIDAMVIVPCSMKTLAAVAHGYSDNLITRSAENMLKLGRKLIVVPRETPLSLAAIENMAALKRGGAVILPPMVAYYNGPKSIEDFERFFAGKIMDVLGLEHAEYRKWVKDQTENDSKNKTS